ncbi:MAG: peroxiredoxin [Schleiferiaceae bacterium]
MQVGDTIPSFELLDQNGKTFSTSDVVGKQNLVIYFYPKDDTPGCTKEACSFRDSFEDFTEAGAMVIGISTDDVASHKAFEEKYNLPFTLLADTDKKVRDQFGVPTSLFGLLQGRVTYIFDKNGVCVHVYDSHLKPTNHINESLEALKAISE